MFDLRMEVVESIRDTVRAKFCARCIAGAKRSGGYRRKSPFGANNAIRLLTGVFPFEAYRECKFVIFEPALLTLTKNF
jgi:hypothetical protein